jgi:hypothetical protein
MTASGKLQPGGKFASRVQAERSRRSPLFRLSRGLFFCRLARPRFRAATAGVMGPETASGSFNGDFTNRKGLQ